MIFIILILGFLLRLISLNQSLWHDEATSALVARDFSVAEILTQFSPGDFHPPFYYLMLHFWIQVFGTSEVAIRMLSILFGVATVWLIYKIAKTIQPSNHLAILSALFLATAPLHIYYSQEARMYVPAAFFAVLSVWFFLKIIKAKKQRVMDWVGLVTVSTLLLYTDYLPVFLFLFFALYLLVFERKHLKRNVTNWLLSTGAILFLFLPWVPMLFGQLAAGLGVQMTNPQWWNVLGGTNVKELALVPIKFMIGRISSENDVLYAASIVIPTVLFASVFLKSVTLWQRTKFVWVWFMLPILAVALVGVRLSVFSYFRLIFLLPPFYLLAAFGALSFKNSKAKFIAMAGLLLVNMVSSSIYLFNSRFHREDWRGAVSFIEQRVQSHALVLFESKSVLPGFSWYSKEVVDGVGGLTPQLYQIIKEREQIFVFQYLVQINDPERVVEETLEENGFVRIATYNFRGVGFVFEYQRGVQLTQDEDWNRYFANSL